MKKHGQQYALNEELIQKATDALFQKFSSSQKPFDMKTSHNLDLGITFKTIPKCRKQIRVRLPHPIYSQQTHTVCILTCFPKDKVKQLIADNNITCVKKVMTIKSLIKKYRQFEARRALVTRYDVFLTDSKACPHVTRILGKVFIQKHKNPIAIHLRPMSLRLEIDKAFSTILFHISSGSTSSIAVGSFDTLTSTQLAANVIQCLKSLMVKIPPGWSNLRNAYVKSFKSLALPIFSGLPNPPPLRISSDRDSTMTINPLPKSVADPESDEYESSEDVITSLETKYSVLDRAGAYEKACSDKSRKRASEEIGGNKKKKRFAIQHNLVTRKKTLSSHTLRRK
ncbi:UTP30-subunit of U3-containing 90S pre-ribosome-like [Oopsacas minuta]|uniref:UTP30-subunit of U3-containing 90S pre-ribosome-like n=1 Tax=Oopsacas minuta TaxID=111878 RepID=A0AAV7K9E6_9METZ|nr:UTP30-subunit of U3-containing 90S pre-ribosome-like [Oopsacas minuta]